MSERLTLQINNRRIEARPGSTLLAAGEAAGIAMPHDCRSGLCESCRIAHLAGRIEDAGTRVSGTVLACKASVLSDGAFAFDPQPLEMKTRGVITARRELAREIIEIRLRVAKPVPYLPGQYVKVAIGTAPERDLCPTLSLDGLRELDELVFHVRLVHEGRLATELVEGRKVTLRGPFGQSFLRNGHGTPRNGRIVLVSSAAGFAPIWAIAVAARLGQPDRPLTMIVSARDPRNLYMRPAFHWLAKHDVSDIILTSSGAVPLPPARHGKASEHLPALVSSDTVHVAGDSEMCAAIQRAANQANAACHAIPFHSAPEAPRTGLAGAISKMFGSDARQPARLSAAARSGRTA